VENAVAVGGDEYAEQRWTGVHHVYVNNRFGRTGQERLGND
jgi:hypothetical protein